MRVIKLFWTIQSMEVRVFILWLFAAFCISTVRLVRLALRLYKSERWPILPEDVMKGPVDPSFLAECALANRTECEGTTDRHAELESSGESESKERALYLLQTADDIFLYLWRKCHTDVESAKRASHLTLLLSFVIAAWGAAPTFQGLCNDSRLRVSECVSTTLLEQFARLAPGLLACSTLYMAASFFERTLAARRISWTYFCARVRNGLRNRSA